MIEYEFHPLANLFPMMSADEHASLVADMTQSGYDERAPITLYQGKILDGRNRYRAAMEAGQEPVYSEYAGMRPLEFVIRHNLHRRHLNESQRAVVAARLANMERGGDRPSEKDKNFDYANLHNRSVSQTDAADMLNISPRMVAAAKAIEKAAPELLAQVEAGEITINAAMREVVRAERKENEVPVPDGKYRVIYADPPWQYGNTMPEYFGEQRDHYSTMTVKEICSLPIKHLAQDNAVLFLWVTSPILEESFEIIRAWGFEYKASFVWDKEKHVMGHYNSVRHEFLLVCVRGSCQPDVQKLFDSVYCESRTEHSKKPEYFRNVIDTIYPEGKRIELFARQTTPGWESWGNEPSVS